MDKGAIISECEKYRYQLWRIWDQDLPIVMFVMLNPSTADADINDPTIRRCIGFAKSWGYGGFFVGNLYAFRSKTPSDLFDVEDPSGEENNFHLSEMSKKCNIIVCAWGNEPIIKKLKIINKPLENINKPLWCIDVSKNGTPKHPLYLKGDLGVMNYVKQF